MPEELRSFLSTFKKVATRSSRRTDGQKRLMLTLKIQGGGRVFILNCQKLDTFSKVNRGLLNRNSEEDEAPWTSQAMTPGTPREEEQSGETSGTQQNLIIS